MTKRKIFDTNNDGKVDFNDAKDFIKKAASALKPIKNIFDVNGDGVVDYRDALDAARITGTATLGAGVTFAAGAIAGTALVTGKAAAISAVIASTISGATAAGLTSVLGTTSALTLMAVETSGGVWIIGIASEIAASTTLISTTTALGATLGGTFDGLVNTIAGMPVIKSIALKAATSSGEVLMIAGIPIAREVALFVGLVAVIVVAGYAYYILTRNSIKAEEVEAFAKTVIPI